MHRMDPLDPFNSPTHIFFFFETIQEATGHGSYIEDKMPIVRISVSPVSPVSPFSPAQVLVICVVGGTPGTTRSNGVRSHTAGSRVTNTPLLTPCSRWWVLTGPSEDSPFTTTISPGGHNQAKGKSQWSYLRTRSSQEVAGI